MPDRTDLHRLVDELPDADVEPVMRFLTALATLDPLDRALHLAPVDDEPDRDDEDGGLTRARRESARGEAISTERLESELPTD